MPQILQQAPRLICCLPTEQPVRACTSGITEQAIARVRFRPSTKQAIEPKRQFGATDFINPTKYSDPIQDVIVELTDGGVDAPLETAPLETTSGAGDRG